MNSKGFTLVEVLAAVTIMVLISLVAVPTSIKFIERGKKQQYDILEDQIISAASKYYIKHKDDTCISIDDLKGANLLNEVDDKFLDDDNNIINPISKEKLTDKVQVNIDGSKVEYQLVSKSICS